MDDPEGFLRSLFSAAIAAASDFSRIIDHLPDAVVGRVLVIGAGKASVAMADALAAGRPNWFDTGHATGFVVAPDGYPSAARLETLFSAHPVPDDRSEIAGRRALAEASSLGPDDILIALVSGGCSSLLVAPREGVTLQDKIDVGRALLKSGLPISVVNAVRRRLSDIKGGGLARAAHPATVHTFVVSDVPGDDPADVGSGPTLCRAGPSPIPADVTARMPIHLSHLVDRAPDHRPCSGAVQLVASSATALAAAASLAESQGVRVINLGGDVEGEAREVAARHAALALDHRGGETSTLILSGGETSVTVTGRGRGGRNSEYALSLALALNGTSGIYALAADTDGIDGAGPSAGAIVHPRTLINAPTRGLDVRLAMRDNDTHPVFETLEDAVITGPTGTNVNDFRAILVLGSESRRDPRGVMDPAGMAPLATT